MRDVGLTVDYDGKRNIAYLNGEAIEYPIGAMMCEYARLSPSELKDTIVKCPMFGETADVDKLSKTFMWLLAQLSEKHGSITSTMIVTEFSSVTADLRTCTEEERSSMIHDISNDEKMKNVKDFILKDTGYSDFGYETVGQLLLVSYMVFATIYTSFKHTFNIFSSEAEIEEDQAMAFWSFYGENFDFQRFTFRIINIDNSFRSIYTIQSSMSLALFEIAHTLDSNTSLVKCKNCGNYFVPARRSDTMYCEYPSPQQSGKTCKEIGAQVTRANKEKNDVTTRQYRKVYMRTKMSARRNPNSSEQLNSLERLTSESKVWRRELADGTKTTEEFLQWLESFH